ncbi:MAG: DUF4270 family protein [Saprospiraceae bacterium]|nr:DUF4270 domain-containing protein [Saprospiraceae bacterium]MDW8229284.1 DUF4270 family protein [Saprospiraceae bacterium]
MRLTQIIPYPAIELLLFGAAIVLLQCSKPTDFGADLLGNERGDFAYTDTLTLRITVEREDSTETSDRTSTSPYLMCGELQDPVFGRTTAALYTLFRPSDLSPRFQNAVVDSIVLFLRYAAEGFYGDTTQPQTVRVHRIAAGSTLRWNQIYYSNQSLPTDELLGEVSGVFPRPRTNLPLFDTIERGPYLRIPLSNAFGQEILNTDSLSLTADTLFWQKIRGLRITAASNTAPGAMLAFNLNNRGFSFIRLYFKYANDTIANSRTFDFSFLGGNKFNHFEHQYAGSLAENYVGKPAQDLLFVQGLSGLRLRVEIPYAHLLDNVAINKAELEMTVADPLGANTHLPPVNQLVLSERPGDSVLLFIPDVAYSLSILNDFSRFGGTPQLTVENGQSIERYRLTLTQRFQAMVDNASGDIKKQTLFVNVFPQSRSARRVVLFGPKSTTFPAKLALKYTRVR